MTCLCALKEQIVNTEKYGTPMEWRYHIITEERVLSFLSRGAKLIIISKMKVILIVGSMAIISYAPIIKMMIPSLVILFTEKWWHIKIVLTQRKSIKQLKEKQIKRIILSKAPIPGKLLIWETTDGHLPLHHHLCLRFTNFLVNPRTVQGTP